MRTSTTIGVSELAADDSFEQLVARADEAMYRGKEAGRNCIMLQHR
ncbi:MAG: diguanylate cyclase [Pseudomonadota bacterium]